MLMLTDSALDIDQYLNADLFQPQSPPSPASTPSSPEQGLLTPPQQAPAPAFHDVSDSLAQPFSFFDDEIKAIDALSSNSPFDFLSSPGTSMDHSMSGYGLPMDLGYQTIPGFSSMGFNMSLPGIPEGMAIDPQLVDTPASTGSFDGEEGDDEASNSTATSPAAVAPSPASTTSSEKDESGHEKLTLTIAPIKVGGHGKARRGTVQSGGISKKSTIGSMSALHRGDKENLSGNTYNAVLLSSSPTTSPSATRPVLPPSSTASPINKGLPKPPTILKAVSSKKGKSKDLEEDDDDDDVPQDWRPSPEVFAKMTSKEKRQLRNKISARNFRVRRKEYISTLEGDIAERDRLLEAIRSELGSTQSENLALRQEIEALKKVLLEGRGAADLPLLNLPPPAPLPVGLRALTPASQYATSITSTEGMVPSPPGTPGPAPTSTGLSHHQQINATSSISSPSAAPSTSTSAAFTPNTQKDLPSSPMPRPFWGGQHTSIIGGLGGGITPVHTTLVPETNVSLWGPAGAGAGKNINPLLNAIGKGFVGGASGAGVPNMFDRSNEKKMVPTLHGFDAFADANMFTMKSLDAYRMQLWGKMAAQHHAHNQQLSQQQRPTSPFLTAQPSSQLTGPASSLRPAYFSSPSLSPKSLPPVSPSSSSNGLGLGSTLSALLSGKHSSTPTGLLTPPTSPRLGAARGTSSGTNTTSTQQQREREAQAAMLAAVASQTLFKKLGNAFWDAFSGSSSSTSSTGPSPSYLSSPTHNQTQQRSWDADKVRKVLEGKAVVRVVDLEPPTIATSTPTTTTTSMQTHTPNTSCARAVCEDVRGCMTDILEESMRSLTLGTKGPGATGPSASSARK